jgi:hypothetical protein
MVAMDDIANLFPKKSRFNNLNLEGLDELEQVDIKTKYNSAISQGYSSSQALDYANREANKLRYEKEIEAEKVKYAEQKQLTDPRPSRNLDGDVTVRRLTAFLNFMNQHASNLLDGQLIEAIENEWSDVIDIPISAWDSDVKGLTLYLIGGGLIVSAGVSWVCIDEPNPNP